MHGLPAPVKNIRAVFLDAGDTLLRADPPVTRVYREAFSRHGVAATEDEVHTAVHATWRDVDLARERGEERWGSLGGEAGFWRRFVGTVFARVGGGPMPEALLGELVAHFAAERHWALYPETLSVLATLRAAGLRLVIVSNWDSTLPSLLERVGLAAAVDDIVVSALVGVSKPAQGNLRRGRPEGRRHARRGAARRRFAGRRLPRGAGGGARGPAPRSPRPGPGRHRGDLFARGGPAPRPRPVDSCDRVAHEREAACGNSCSGRRPSSSSRRASTKPAARL